MAGISSLRTIAKLFAKTTSQVGKQAKTLSKAGEVNVGKVYTNTSGRISRLQDAKSVFTPYPTSVRHESIPTAQKIDDMLGITKFAGLKDGQIANRQKCADALAIFKRDLVPPVKGSPVRTTSVPTQRYLDEMLGINKVDDLISAENGNLVKSVLSRRNDARSTFKAMNELPIGRRSSLNASTLAPCPKTSTTDKFAQRYEKYFGKKTKPKNTFDAKKYYENNYKSFQKATDTATADLHKFTKIS
ncbi:MAG: hypothetical protein R3Y28_05195 [Candidatus Gastranaerophilales bacterium]